MHVLIVAERPYSRSELENNVAVSHAYLKRSFEWLGKAVTDDDLRLATTFILSAEGEIKAWMARLEGYDARPTIPRD